MRLFGMVMFQPGASDAVEMLGAEEDKMVQTLTPNRVDEALTTLARRTPE